MEEPSAISPVERIELSAAGLAALLSLSPGEPLDSVWRFEQIYPYHEGGRVLVFGEQDGGRSTLHLEVRHRDDRRPAWRRTAHFDLVHRVPDDADRQGALTSLGLLVDRLAALDGEATQVDEPDPARDAVGGAGAEEELEREREALELPARWQVESPSPFDYRRVFVITPEADCGLDCAFCSVRTDASVAGGGGEEVLQRHVLSMEQAFAEGWTTLRISGFDPLESPWIIELAAAASRIGFEHVHIYSPGSRYSDCAFLESFLSALPQSFTLHIPLYGASGPVHDRVVGVVGHFERVIAGLESIRALGRMEHVLFVTVAQRGNKDELPALRRLFNSYGAPVQVFLPWPATRGEHDRFYQAALPQSELVEAMVRCEPPMGLAELLPCVRFWHQRETGAPAFSRGGFHRRPAPTAMLYEEGDYKKAGEWRIDQPHTTPVVQCPHLDSCSLAGVCHQRVYQAYATTFGLEELRPVSVFELLELQGT